MDWAEHPILRKIILAIPILILINIFVLDVLFVTYVFGNKKNQSQLTAINTPIPPTAIPTNPSCPAACLDVIKIATSALTPTVTTQATPKGQVSKLKEFYIPLGASSFYSTDDWGDVVGLQAYIDSNNFESIKSVVFEASVHAAPNQDVSVRLFNATDKHPVWFSDLSFPSGTEANFQTSAPITLVPGNKLYKVQMKTQFRTAANLDQARIHITFK